MGETSRFGRFFNARGSWRDTDDLVAPTQNDPGAKAGVVLYTQAWVGGGVRLDGAPTSRPGLDYEVVMPPGQVGRCRRDKCPVSASPNTGPACG